MEPICLFEAGGTKTTVLLSVGENLEEHTLSGFNPNRYSEDFEKELAELELPARCYMVFYGSGLVSDQNKQIVQDILKKRFGQSGFIFDDQLGAARAAYGDAPGLIGIMGTGAVAAWYDGQQLVDRKGGYGYLLDDIGGGFELGKVILSNWLNNDLPPLVDAAVSAHVKISKADFTTWFYKNIDLSLPAGLTKVIAQHQKDSVVNELLNTYFELYFGRHVAPILKKNPVSEMRLVGGLAQVFNTSIKVAAKRYGLESIKVIENPAVQLLKYHRQKGFSSHVL